MRRKSRDLTRYEWQVGTLGLLSAFIDAAVAVVHSNVVSSDHCELAWPKRIMFKGTKVPYLDRKDGHVIILSLLNVREEKPRTYPLYGGKLLIGFLMAL